MKKCKTCCFWSEMIACAKACGPLTAMCLNDNSNYHKKMTKESDGCEDWEEGTPIDAP
jgi:hypothetical protein